MTNRQIVVLVVVLVCVLLVGPCLLVGLVVLAWCFMPISPSPSPAPPVPIERPADHEAAPPMGDKQDGPRLAPEGEPKPQR
jgi:hypothetical protein